MAAGAARPVSIAPERSYVARSGLPGDRLMHDHGCTPLRVTAPTRDFDRYRSSMSGLFVPLEMSLASPGPFRGATWYRVIDGVHLAQIGATPHIVTRTPGQAHGGDAPYFKLSYQLRGGAHFAQDGRDADLRPGDLAIYDTSRPYRLATGDEASFLFLMIPQDRIDLPPRSVRKLTATRIEGGAGMAGVLAPQLRYLADHIDELGRPPGRRLVRNTLDLLTTLLFSELGGERSTERDGDALMPRILAFIDENLAGPLITPARITAEHHVSVSRLHGLFRERGITVSGWVREQRLERVRRDLADPIMADRPISAVAARWGLTDASHFSRLFKARFGVSPREFRHGGGEGDSGDESASGIRTGVFADGAGRA